MLARFMVLLVAGTALAGCCASGTGCSTTPMAGAPIAWDGLGEPPTANDAPGEERRPQAKNGAQSRDHPRPAEWSPGPIGRQGAV